VIIFTARATLDAAWIADDLTLRSYDAGPQAEAQAYANGLVAARGAAGAAGVARGAAAGLWPTAGYLPGVLLTQLLGDGISGLKRANLFYLAALLVCLFLLGRRLHSAAAGLLAAALVTLYPGVYGEGRQFGVDLPGMVVLTFNVLLLVDNRDWRGPGRAAALGLGAGIGALIRPQSLLFVALPALYLLVRALWRADGRGRLRALAVAALAALTAAGTSAPWWAGRLGEIAELAARHRTGELGEGIPTTVSSPLFYAKALPWCASPFLLLLAVVAVGGIVEARVKARATRFGGGALGLLVTWLAGGGALLCSFSVRAMRYMLPLCPALALLTACGLLTVASRRVRRLLVGLTLGVGGLTLVVDSFFVAGPVRFGPDPYPGNQELRLVVTSGPPGTNPAVVAGEALAGAIRRSYGPAGELVIEYEAGAPEALWTIKPILRAALPGVALRPMGAHVDTPGREQIGGAVFPALPRARRRCLAFTVSRPAGAQRTPPPEGARRVVSISAFRSRRYTGNMGLERELLVELWRHGRCPRM
jgi:hypothetical protein